MLELGPHIATGYHLYIWPIKRPLGTGTYVGITEP